MNVGPWEFGIILIALLTSIVFSAIAIADSLEARGRQKGLRRLYFLVTKLDPRELDLSKGRFILRHWDGMDGTWTDCTQPVSADEVLRAWNRRTSNGTKYVNFHDLDYYRIFPADTHMLWSDGREMFR